MGMTTFVICSANNLSTRIKGKGKAQSQSLIERTKVNNTLIYLGIPLWKHWSTWVRFSWLTEGLEGFPELLFATIKGLFLQMIFSSQWRKFSIEISNPGLFCVSQWDPPGMWPDNLFICSGQDFNERCVFSLVHNLQGFGDNPDAFYHLGPYCYQPGQVGMEVDYLPH